MSDTKIAGLGSAALSGAATGVKSGTVLKLKSYDSNAKKLEVGNHLLSFRCPALIGKALAALNRTWTFATGAFEKVASQNGQTVKFPHTNFVDPQTGLDKLGGKYQARKWYDDKKGVLYVHFAVVR